jgi:para-aminobenzoate synthetase
MTGAPKKRTIEILEDLEQQPRSVYSGVLGFFSLVGKACDFSVVIRTAVCTRDRVTVGAGGAIVYLSDPEMEFEEMMLKSESVVPSVLEALEG